MVVGGLSPIPLGSFVLSLSPLSAHFICDFLLFALIVESLGKRNISLRSFSILQLSLTPTPLLADSWFPSMHSTYWFVGKEKYLSSVLGNKKCPSSILLAFIVVPHSHFFLPLVCRLSSRRSAWWWCFPHLLAVRRPWWQCDWPPLHGWSCCRHFLPRARSWWGPILWLFLSWA
jgi:hypothetical protein